MRKIVIATIAISLGLASLPASAARCKHKADRSAELELDGAGIVEIYALAGDLVVRGRNDLTAVQATGDACVSKQEMLAETDITIRRTGDRIQVLAEMPDTSDEGDGQWEDEYAVMDLEIDLPAGVGVVVYDSSGEMKVTNLASAEITDSSGGIDIRDITGPVVIPQDSSGDIYMERVGEVTIQVDSSGEIEIRDADAVTIANDTSGDIFVSDIRGSVLVGNDSSGKITARGVGGDLIVENDTSGGISYDRVVGKVSLPEQR
jgi:DUF4097 and DUF4098 domain-containing protein YvlB